MQITNRVVESNSWVLMTLLFGLVLLFLVKKINSQLIENYAKAFFIKGLIEKKSQEKTIFFSLTNLFLFLFSGIVLALFLVLISKYYLTEIEADFTTFTYFLSGLLVYILSNYFLEYLFIRIFSLRNVLTYFLTSKRIYLFTFSIWLFPIIVLSFYTFNSGIPLLIMAFLLFLMSLILIFTNNKNLIVSELFYFILYLCLLKIAPLLIIYKIMF